MWDSVVSWIPHAVLFYIPSFRESVKQKAFLVHMMYFYLWDHSFLFFSQVAFIGNQTSISEMKEIHKKQK